MAGANTSPYAPHSTPRAMSINVRLITGRRFEYQGLFAHTFDAYDDALEQHGTAIARIEVAVLPPVTQAERAAA